MKKPCKERSLAFKNPKLSKEWDYEKNYPLIPEDVFVRGHKKVWWKCKKGHRWPSIIKGRNNGVGCPYCSGQKVCIDNCLATLNPELVKEWHLTKNGKLTPYDFTVNSGKIIWWICKKCKKEWTSPISNRNYGHGCPVCYKIKLKDGSVCDSLTEAYYYLGLKSKGVEFKHHIRIGLGKRTCDFYIPSLNRYIEVTGYHKKWKYWKVYYKKILRKKRHIIGTFKAKFEFVKIVLTPEQVRYVRENTV